MSMLRETEVHKARLALLEIVGGGKTSFGPSLLRGPTGLRLDDRPLVLIVGDQSDVLDYDDLVPMAQASECDVVATYLDEHSSGHPFIFDVVLMRGSGPVWHAGLHLCLVDGMAPMFVPRQGAGPAIVIADGMLTPMAGREMPSEAQRLEGVARGHAALQSRIRPHRSSDSGLGEHGRVDAHPATLVIVMPMYEPVDYRHALRAIDDSLVVRRRGDGSFLFELRPMRRLGPRSYAKWVLDLADDLVAGHVVVIVDRDEFLSDIEELARSNVSARQRPALERAIAFIAERTRYQIQDHLDGADAQACTRRHLISRRPRRTKERPGYPDGLNSIGGMPTPRAEQLWNTMLHEWCDVRTRQHGRSAWERWVRKNRPDMPASDPLLRPRPARRVGAEEARHTPGRPRKVPGRVR